MPAKDPLEDVVRAWIDTHKAEMLAGDPLLTAMLTGKISTGHVDALLGCTGLYLMAGQSWTADYGCPKSPTPEQARDWARKTYAALIGVTKVDTLNRALSEAADAQGKVEIAEETSAKYEAPR